MKWLADENLHGAITRGLLRRAPRLDLIRTQDLADVRGGSDLDLLQFATATNRIVLTHDLSTMIPAMLHHLTVVGRCAPIVLVPDSLSVLDAIADIMLLDQCATAADWDAGVIYLPLA